MGRLTVEPTAGLANRLRVVDSAIALSQAARIPLTIVWTRTPDLAARFDTLFNPIRDVRVVERSWTQSRIVRAIGTRVRYRPFITQPEVERRLASGSGFDDVASAGHPFIITCSRFMPAAGHARTLAAASSVGDAVAVATARFDAFTVGVHVRRTDNHLAVRFSPTEAFEAAMRAEIEREPRTRFFLATDDPAESIRLQQAFPDRVITLSKRLDRSDPLAARDALIDLQCLARTREILGSYWSAYSEMAAEIGGIPLRVVGLR